MSIKVNIKNQAKKIQLKIGQPYLDTKTLKIRVIRNCSFGYVKYDVFIAEMNSQGNGCWVTQVMPHYQFRNNVEQNRFVIYQGELPKVNYFEVI